MQTKTAIVLFILMLVQSGDAVVLDNAAFRSRQQAEVIGLVLLKMEQ